MLGLAWNLWAGNKASTVNVARLLDTCDARMLRLALKAIKARNGDPLTTGGALPPQSPRV